jgi:hypothetical protein
MIRAAREQALTAVNTALIDLYWRSADRNRAIIDRSRDPIDRRRWTE